jgi:hypothetical protein
VLGHPALITRNVRGNTQGETLLSEKRIPSVSRTITPDFPALWKMHNVFCTVARPRYIRLAVSQRSANTVHARHDTLQAFVNLGEDGLPDASHNAHTHHNIGRVSELNTELRHGRPNGSHAERQDVHRTPAHASAEDLF